MIILIVNIYMFLVNENHTRFNTFIPQPLPVLSNIVGSNFIFLFFYGLCLYRLT